MDQADRRELAGRLDGHQRLIDERLQVLFGESSDKSVQQAVRKFVVEYQATVVKEISEDRMRLRRELTELINGAGNPDHPIAKISGQLTELRKEIAVDLEAARAATTALDARKSTGRGGLDYQADVYAVVAELLRGTDDEVDLKGRSPGATGGAEGDIVINIDAALTGGITARIAVEVTKQAGLTASKLKAMLKKAKEDRAAQVAVVVIRDPTILGGQRMMVFPGLGAVTVYEPDDPDEYRALAVNVALKHAKAVASVSSDLLQPTGMTHRSNAPARGPRMPSRGSTTSSGLSRRSSGSRKRRAQMQRTCGARSRMLSRRSTTRFPVHSSPR